MTSTTTISEIETLMSDVTSIITIPNITTKDITSTDTTKITTTQTTPTMRPQHDPTQRTIEKIGTEYNAGRHIIDSEFVGRIVAMIADKNATEDEQVGDKCDLPEPVTKKRCMMDSQGMMELEQTTKSLCLQSNQPLIDPYIVDAINHKNYRRAIEMLVMASSVFEPSTTLVQYTQDLGYPFSKSPRAVQNTTGLFVSADAGNTRNTMPSATGTLNIKTNIPQILNAIMTGAILSVFPQYASKNHGGYGRNDPAWSMDTPPEPDQNIPTSIDRLKKMKRSDKKLDYVMSAIFFVNLSTAIKATFCDASIRTSSTTTYPQSIYDAIKLLPTYRIRDIEFTSHTPSSSELFEKCVNGFHMFLVGLGFEFLYNDYTQALPWYQVAKSLGCVLAMDRIVYYTRTVDPFIPSHYLENTRACARSGCIGCAHNLGDMYRCGTDYLSVDLGMAIHWYTQSANADYIPSMRRIAAIARTADTQYYNLDVAAHWWRVAAELGDCSSQHDIALCYFRGEGISRDFTKMFRMLHLAAYSGVAMAQIRLGTLLAEGTVIARDFDAAIEWFKRAEKNKATSVLATYCRGVCYGLIGDDANKIKAVECFRLSALGGHTESKYHYARCLYNGDGTPVNRVAAFKWFVDAANEGKVDACGIIGKMYECGVGTSRDFDEAAKWYERASSSTETEIAAHYYSFGNAITNTNARGRIDGHTKTTFSSLSDIEWYIKSIDRIYTANPASVENQLTTFINQAISDGNDRALRVFNAHRLYHTSAFAKDHTTPRDVDMAMLETETVMF